MFARLAKAAYKINFVMSYMSNSDRPLNIFDIDELIQARNILDEIIQSYRQANERSSK